MRVAVRLGLVAAAVLAVFFAFRHGLVPARINPFAAVDLADPRAWFIDWRLAALQGDPAQCRRIMQLPHILAEPIADQPPKDRCGWSNAVRTTTVGGARLSLDKATCSLAAALSLWMEHDVQPLALEHLGQRVASIQHAGGYACRNITGMRLLRNVRSEHAGANAIDLFGFVLADGRQVSVLRHWPGDAREARFLHAIHARACRYFRVVLGPEFNVQHKDHFHFDRGPLWRCR